MTIIRTTCQSCGDIELPAWAVTVTLTDHAEGLLVFTCPECESDGQVDADAAAVALLKAAGVHIALNCDPLPVLTETDICQAQVFLESMDTLCEHQCLLG